MTGQEIQDRLDAIVLDLQTTGKGREVRVLVRNDLNQGEEYQLVSDVNGVVNASQLALLQALVDSMKPYADAYDLESGDITTANANFKAAQAPHQTLIDDAKTSRDALSAALEADANYQSAKSAVDVARTDANYITARTNYQNKNIGENYAELQKAKGAYVVV